MPRLTTQQCHQAIAAAGPSVKKIADGGGLYLFVKNGRAYWTWQFRNGDGWSSKGFGAFPSVTPKAAREAAEAYRVALRSGTVITAVKPRQARSVAAGKSFAEALEEWLITNPRGVKIQGYQGAAHSHQTSLASLDVAQITQADVISCARQRNASTTRIQARMARGLFLARQDERLAQGGSSEPGTLR